jgi:ABC-2 type transport system ATP-binding protein
MSENVIETERLTVYYGKHRGIEDVDLSVQRGEVFGFLGPNGAGKSTTQRILMDVIRPSAGRATIFGLDCRKQGSEIRQRVGYLPGELNLYRNMTADGFLNLLQSINGSRQDKRYRQTLYERLD